MKMVKAKNSPIFLVLLLSLIAVSCSSYSKSDGRALRKKKPAKSLATIPKTQISFGKKLNFEITEDSPVYKFNEGKSYTKLFTLPQVSGQRELTVKSYCDCLRFGKRVLVPNVLVYDKNFRQLLKLKFKPHPPTTWEPIHFVATQKIPKAASYVVVYSDPQTWGMNLASVEYKKWNVEKLETKSFAAWWTGTLFGELRIVVDHPHKKD